ncbi:MAG: molecular chaperone TorD family protein [Telluria sp.]|nr:molecular chaperone TorD family protein [Telluria sp.]
MNASKPLQCEAPDQGEEAARADLYGLLATLFFAPPPQSLIDTIAAAHSAGDGVLERAWAELALACKNARAEQVREEYEQLFISTGKPEVMLYGSYYLSGFLMEKPLAALRTDLAEFGLERVATMTESEDHIAVLCEVMRILIASEGGLQADIAAQRTFFANHMQAWVPDACEAISASRHAGLYAAVAKLARTFFEVETQAFDME